MERCLEMLSDRHGEAFEFIRWEEEGRVDDLRTYSFVLSPSGGEPRPFTATIRCGAQDGAYADGPFSDYPQYLFKGRAEAPFLESLGSCPGLAGYSAELSGVRYDERLWAEGEFDEYMGRGGMRDPSVRVVAMLPRGASLEEWSGIAHRCLEGLFGLGLKAECYVSVEGYDPFKNALVAPDPDYICPGSRKPLPPESEMLDDFGWWERCEHAALWDGAGHPDGLVEDPSHLTSYPFITWNPGYGPEYW